MGKVIEFLFYFWGEAEGGGGRGGRRKSWNSEMKVKRTLLQKMK